MKKLLTLACIVMSSQVLADTKVTGVAAKKLFNDLAGLYEYTSGARTPGLSIETITRHDNGTTICSQDTVTYNTGASEVSFECIIKS